MLHIGYITPYRVILLVLIRRLCTRDYPEDLISKFVIYLTKSILNEDSVRETCSEPVLNQVLQDIRAFSENEGSIDATIISITEELETIDTPYHFDEFMACTYLDRTYDPDSRLT
ncbi:hypothetical protein HPULCUR_009138 [Helicostylum pulchrum]|uniref:Uncharacterized protein n=1 Tax=Helicostylum pulchrum TaxID=562976 RepID=A0ABP9Y9K5_9FUNG